MAVLTGGVSAAQDKRSRRFWPARPSSRRSPPTYR